MSGGFKRCLLALLFFSAVEGIQAQEKGMPIFSDAFDTSATFAENWVPTDKRVVSKDGAVHFPGLGSMSLRRGTPIEFLAEMDVRIGVAGFEKKVAAGQAFCGFMIDGYRFMVRPNGRTWMIYKLNGWKRSRGKSVVIPGFKLRGEVKLVLIRKVDGNTATYSFKVNGAPAGSFVCEAPKTAKSQGGMPVSAKPLLIFSYCLNMAVDDFAIYSLKRSDADSPNVIINSSFERAQDGFPLYYCRSGFNYANGDKIPYERFLAQWTLDTAEKHSGRQSLKMVFDPKMGGGQLFAWGAGTVKDMPGVFSVWMKSDRDALPIKIRYGKSKIVKVGTEWKRYEIVNPKLPGVGIYTPVGISFVKVPGTLWVDDLQAEFITSFDEAKLKAGATFATPYKPSELDKQRFGERPAPVRAAEFAIPKLPAGVAPKGDWDSWKDHAVKLDEFHNKLAPARDKTETFIACDDTNLYVGYRCFVDDLSKINTKRDPHDSFSVFGKDSVEFFLDPSCDGRFYQFAADAGGTRLDIGQGRNVAWNGNWKSVVKLNEKRKSVDYEITIPFSTLSSGTMSARWLVNFCRNDNTVKEHVSIAKTPILGFQQTKYWAYARLPAEIVRKYSVGLISGGYSTNGAETAISLTLSNLTGRAINCEAKLLDAQNGSAVLAEKPLSLKKGANEISFVLKDAVSQVRLKLAENGAPLMDQTVLLEKRAPVSMLGRLNYYMNEREAVFKVSAKLADVEKMTAVLTVGGEKVEKRASAAFKIAFPLKNVPNGTSEARLVLRKDGRQVATTSAKLVKRPFRKGATQVNHFTRSLIHDGKPVFPFAPFFVAWKHYSDEFVRGSVDFFAAHGFKYLHILADQRVPKRGVIALKRAEEKGVDVLLWTKYHGLPESKVDEMIKMFDFPNVLSQMVMDEPELGMKSDVARAFLREMRAKFPYHPVHMNNTVLGIPNRYANLETDILMLDDYLTNVENRSVASVVKGADVMMKAGEAEGKPAFYFLVGGNFPLHYREPSYKEQIAQTYGCVAAGCTGLSYFYGNVATPGNWKAYIQLNKEILSLTNVLLSEEEVDQAVCSADPKIVRSLTRRRNGFLYVVSCNVEPEPLDEVAFKLPASLSYPEKAEVLFEDRTVKVEDGKFTDSFKGHSRHVYKIRIK